MTGQVVVLTLSGLDQDEALRDARDLINNHTVADLSRLLVVNDVATLLAHESTFSELLRSHRLNHLLCVAIGGLDGKSRLLTLPGNISGAQGSATLWVSDSLGIDVALKASAVARMRPGTAPSGLQRLTDVLAAAEVFDRVRELVVKLHPGVASPGMRLARTGEESTNFPAVLSYAIRQLVSPTQPGDGGQTDPIVSAARTAAATFSEGSALVSARDRTVARAEDADHELDDLVKLGEFLRASSAASSARASVVSTGEELTALRTEVAGLMDFAHSPGGLTESQRQRLRRAGLQLDVREPEGTTGSQASVSPELDTVRKAVAERVQAGDSLPLVLEGLSIAERHLRPKGSRSYGKDVEDRCRPELIARLSDPPGLPGYQPWLPVTGFAAAVLGSLAGSLDGLIAGAVAALAWAGLIALTSGGRVVGEPRKTRIALVVNTLAAVVGIIVGWRLGTAVKPGTAVVAAGIVLAIIVLLGSAVAAWRQRVVQWRHELRPAEAASAAGNLADLVLTVATAEWSERRVMHEAVLQIRLVVQGIRDQLAEYADGVRDSDENWSAQAARLSGSLVSTLRQLILTVLDANPAQGHSDGQIAVQQAKARAGELIKDWVTIVRERGPLTAPSFAKTVGDQATYYSDDELQSITAAVSYEPDDVMWQLCAPTDLTFLEIGGRLASFSFAPERARNAMRTRLPAGVVATTTGQDAGLIRLVPLRQSSVKTTWSGRTPTEPPE